MKIRFNIGIFSFILILFAAGGFAQPEAPALSDTELHNLAQDNPQGYIDYILVHPEQYSYENFQAAVENDPTLAITIAEQDPQAYATLISRDIRIANDNPLSVRYYAANAGIPDFAMQPGAQFSSCTIGGTCTTKGDNSVTFTFKTLSPPTARFDILPDGRINIAVSSLDSEGRIDAKKILVSSAIIEGNKITAKSNKNPASVTKGGERLFFSEGTISEEGITFTAKAKVQVDTDNDGEIDMVFTADNGAIYHNLPCANKKANCVSINEEADGKKRLSLSGKGINVNRYVDEKGNPKGAVSYLSVFPASETEKPEITVRDEGKVAPTVIHFSKLGMSVKRGKSYSKPSGWDNIYVEAAKEVQVKGQATKTIDYAYDYRFLGDSRIRASICNAEGGYCNYFDDNAIMTDREFTEFMSTINVWRDWYPLASKVIADQPEDNVITVEILLGLIQHESGGNPKIVGSDPTDMGLTQFNSRCSGGSGSTAMRYGLCNDCACSIDQRGNPEKAAYASVRYLNDIYKFLEKRGDVKKGSLIDFTIAGYNAGEGTISAIIDAAKKGTGKEVISTEDVWPEHGKNPYIFEGVSKFPRLFRNPYFKTGIVRDYAPSIIENSERAALPPMEVNIMKDEPDPPPEEPAEAISTFHEQTCRALHPPGTKRDSCRENQYFLIRCYASRTCWEEVCNSMHPPGADREACINNEHD